MANKVCITKDQEDGLKKAMAAGDFSLAKLQKTESSAERLELVRKHIPDEEVSKKIVRDIETRLSSKKEAIIEDYITRTLTTVPEESRKGVLNKFKRMQGVLGAKEEKDFLEELVAHKFGAYLTKDEANKLEKLTMEAMTLREKIPTDATELTPESLEYGTKLVELENRQGAILKEKTTVTLKDMEKLKGQETFKQVSTWSKYVTSTGLVLSGAARSFKASVDLSVGRQLWKILGSGVAESALSAGTNNRKIKIWWSAMKKNIEAATQTAKYGDERVYDAVRAEVHAHPNSYNGVFDVARGSYGLRVEAEEAFPSSIPSEMFEKYGSKVGNVFKISEVAYNTSVLKARFDLANLTIETLSKGPQGVNMMDKKYAQPASNFVSAFTGRAFLGKFEESATVLNNIFFAPRFAVSQFTPFYEIATGVTTRIDNPASLLAAKNNMEYLVGTAAMLFAAEAARSFYTGDKPDYTAILDPRSNQFGKVKVPGTNITLDLTGGNRSVVGLFGKMFSNKYYDARLGTWREKGFFQTTEGKPFYDFVTGKYAPMPSLLRDLVKGEHFGGEEISALSIANNLLMPITVGNVITEWSTKKDFSSALVVILAEGFGVGASDFRFQPQGDEWSSLLNTDAKTYYKAVDELWVSVYDKSKALRTDKAFQALPRSEQAKKLEKMYKRELDKVIAQDKYSEVYAEKLKEVEAEKEVSILDK